MPKKNNKNKPSAYRALHRFSEMKNEIGSEVGADLNKGTNHGSTAVQTGRRDGSKEDQAVRSVESQMSGVPSNTRRAKP